MPFSAYKSFSAVLKEFQIFHSESNFIVETEFQIPDYFRENLDIVIQDGVVDNSEYAICEYLIVPILQEVWKHYRTKFILWSHQTITADDKLSGIPEYILAKKSPLGKRIFDQPYFVIIEAKQDNFDGGWAQCLVEAIAAQKLNEKTEQVVFGIVSNGAVWQFGKLKSNVFTRNQNFYSIQELDRLFDAINYIFQQCELMLDAEANSSPSPRSFGD
jgi:hypothetical protein